MLLNPSYAKLFRTHILYQGGRGHLEPPTISSTLGCTNLKFCKVLEIPFKVSENIRFVKNLWYGYHGNCLITCFFFTNNCPKEYEKQVFFKCSQKPQIKRCKKKTLCYDSSILVLFKTVILKWARVPDF